jgi:hypothetical protein
VTRELSVSLCVFRAPLPAGGRALLTLIARKHLLVDGAGTDEIVHHIRDKATRDL